MCCETTWAPCRVGALACEAARLVVERRGIEESDPKRWRAIDLRLEAIEAEAGSVRAVSPAGKFLQACIGAGDATPGDARDCLVQLSCELAISTMTPLLAYYVGTEGLPTDEPSTPARPALPG